MLTASEIARRATRAGAQAARAPLAWAASAIEAAVIDMNATRTSMFTLFDMPIAAISTGPSRPAKNTLVKLVRDWRVLARITGRASFQTGPKWGSRSENHRLITDESTPRAAPGASGTALVYGCSPRGRVYPEPWRLGPAGAVAPGRGPGNEQLSDQDP